MSNVITEVEIVPIKPKNGLIAFASLVFDNKLYLGSIGVHTRLDGEGLRLTYPTKKIGEHHINFFHPLNKDLSKEIEEVVFRKVKDITNYPL